MSFFDRVELESWLAGIPSPVKASKSYPKPPDASSSVRILRHQGGAKAFAKVNSGTHPFLCINEWTASCLALLSGFDALPVSQIRWEGRLSVGWPLLNPWERVLGEVSLAHPGYQGCGNAGRLPYQAAALDAWLVNPDRSASNVLVKLGTSAYLIDHDRACFDRAQYRGPDELRELTEDPEDGWVPGGTAWTVDEASWRHGVRSVQPLERAIDQCRAVPRQDIEKVIAMAPEEWASDEHRAYLVEFVLRRQDHLRAIMQRWKQTFDELGQWQ